MRVHATVFLESAAEKKPLLRALEISLEIYSALVYRFFFKKIISAFLHHTWFDRVWPVIRVEETAAERAEREDRGGPGFTTMRPECLTAPEMDR